MGAAGMVDAVRGVALAMAILCTLVCCLRLYTRWVVVRTFEIDDYLVILALFLVDAYSALAYTFTYYGLGLHHEDIPNDDTEVWLKIYYVALCSTLVVSAVVKLSLTSSIMRIFPQQNHIKFISRSLILFLTLFTISGVLALVFQCNPIRAFWDKTRTIEPIPDSGACFSAGKTFAINMYQGVLLFVFDIFLLTLPIPTVWKLDMPARQRVLVLLLFGLGLLACAAALVRFVIVVYVQNTTDMPFITAPSLICTIIESALALLTGSLPTIHQSFPVSMSSNGSSRSRAGARWAASHPHSATVYELGNNWRRKRGDGILKISEVHTSFHEYRASMLARPESQERIVPGQVGGGGSGGGGIYGLGGGRWGGVRVDVSSTPRY